MVQTIPELIAYPCFMAILRVLVRSKKISYIYTCRNIFCFLSMGLFQSICFSEFLVVLKIFSCDSSCIFDNVCRLVLPLPKSFTCNIKVFFFLGALAPLYLTGLHSVSW